MMTQQPEINGFEQWVRKLMAHHGTAVASEPAIAEVYQSSTISALLDGVYDGDVTVAEILRHGDFGLGTFNRLDGEMVILDGICYRLRADGTAMPAAATDRTPFAAVTHFHTDFTIPIRSNTSRDSIIRTIDAKISSPNLIHAIRITGRFSALHTRTVRAQTPPYPPLTTAAEEQAENVFDHSTGVLVGFRTPDYQQGISVAGYHLHFLDADRVNGGHVLDFYLDEGEIAISTSSQLHLSLPATGQFLHAKLSGVDLADQIRRAEGGTSPHPQA